jgi:hypothetical protein
LRQLHQDETLAATGTVFQVGGGAKYLFGSRTRRRLKGFGLRAQAGVEARRKGVAFDGGALFSPVAEASLFARF